MPVVSLCRWALRIVLRDHTVQLTGLPSTYCTVTWLLASGRSNNCLARRFPTALENLMREIDRAGMNEPFSDSLSVQA
jgi:hypothetical protein